MDEGAMGSFVSVAGPPTLHVPPPHSLLNLNAASAVEPSADAYPALTDLKSALTSKEYQTAVV